MGLDDSPVSYIRVREPLMATQFQAHSSVLVSPLRLWEGAMRRHSKESSQPVKARRRKTVTRKRQNAPKARPHRSIADTHQTDLARVIRERDEALEQQAAISETKR